MGSCIIVDMSAENIKSVGDNEAKASRVRKIIHDLFGPAPIMDTDYEYVFPYASYKGPVDEAKPVIDVLLDMKYGKNPSDT